MDLTSANKLLICLRYGIGDLVMETPVLESLRRLLPRAHIKAVGSCPAIELLQGDPRVDEVYAVQDLGVRHWGDAGDTQLHESIRSWLRRQKYDLVLDVSHAAMAVRNVIWEEETDILDASIEHLPVERMQAATKELRRVLRTGGRLLLTTDYYRDSSAELWYQGPGERFRVDWSFFDEAALRARIMEAPGFSVEGDVDFRVDWESMSPLMLQFHGYPYTSVGITLVKV